MGPRRGLFILTALSTGCQSPARIIPEVPGPGEMKSGLYVLSLEGEGRWFVEDTPAQSFRFATKSAEQLDIQLLRWRCASLRALGLDVSSRRVGAAGPIRIPDQRLVPTEPEGWGETEVDPGVLEALDLDPAVRSACSYSEGFSLERPLVGERVINVRVPLGDGSAVIGSADIGLFKVSPPDRSEQISLVGPEGELIPDRAGGVGGDVLWLSDAKGRLWSGPVEGGAFEVMEPNPAVRDCARPVERPDRMVAMAVSPDAREVFVVSDDGSLARFITETRSWQVPLPAETEDGGRCPHASAGARWLGPGQVIFFLSNRPGVQIWSERDEPALRFELEGAPNAVTSIDIVPGYGVLVGTEAGRIWQRRAGGGFDHEPLLQATVGAVFGAYGWGDEGGLLVYAGTGFTQHAPELELMRCGQVPALIEGTADSIISLSDGVLVLPAARRGGAARISFLRPRPPGLCEAYAR